MLLGWVLYGTLQNFGREATRSMVLTGLLSLSEMFDFKFVLSCSRVDEFIFICFVSFGFCIFNKWDLEIQLIGFGVYEGESSVRRFGFGRFVQLSVRVFVVRGLQVFILRSGQGVLLFDEREFGFFG